MYAVEVDRKTSTLVGLKAGKPCTDADNARLVRAVVALFEGRRSPEPACLLLVVDPDQPPASPLWRKQFASALPLKSPFRMAVVTSSAAQRGVFTAIEWMRPLARSQKITTVPSFEEAAAWLSAEGCQGAGRVLKPLLARARERAGRPAGDGKTCLMPAVAAD